MCTECVYFMFVYVHVHVGDVKCVIESFDIGAQLKDIAVCVSAH